MVIIFSGCNFESLFLEYHKASAGIEDGTIKDNQMKSSNHPNDPHPAHEARLNHRGAWCGNTLRRHLYLQIDFLSNFEGGCLSSDLTSESPDMMSLHFIRLMTSYPV
jgi:hypothetical protein